MWTWQLSLLALVAPLARPAASAPSPAVSGLSSSGAQFSHAYNPYNQLYNQQTYPQPYNQQTYNQQTYNQKTYNQQTYNQQTYPYNTAQPNNNVYNNVYYQNGDSSYDPKGYNNNQYDTQTIGKSVTGSQRISQGSHKPLKTDYEDDGKYDPKKYDTGHYDAKLYNSGKHNARNYDSGQYDHAKYGTRPVQSAKLTQTLGSGSFSAKSAGAESRLVNRKPGSTGYFIHSDGNGRYKWGQHGQYGYSVKGSGNVNAKKPSFVQKDTNLHANRLSYLQNDFAHKTKEPVKKSSVGKDFGFNTKDVFSKIDVLGPNNKQLFTGGRRVFNDGQVRGPSTFEPSNSGPDDVRRGPISRADSYGFYSDPSNLYSEKSFDGNQLPGQTFNQRQASDNLKFSDNQPTAPSFGPTLPAGSGQGVVSTNSFDRQAVTPSAAATDDSYGYYSDVSTLYGDKPWKQADSTSGFDATPTFKDFDAELSENQLDFGNQRVVPGQFSQKVSQTNQGFDTNKSATKSKKVTGGFDRASSFGSFNTGPMAARPTATGPNFDSQQTRAGGDFNRKASTVDAGFDSYGFYSDPDNLYRADSSQDLRAGPVTRGQSQLNPALTRHRDRSPAPADPTRHLQTQTRVGDRTDPTHQFQTQTQVRDRTAQDSDLGGFGRGDLDSSRSQNAVDFDSYGFYSDPSNLYT